MTDIGSVVIIFGVSVLLFDTVGALASRYFGFPYSALTFGSLVIYMFLGWAVTSRQSITSAALTGALVAFIDATIGWAISWRIGPGKVEATSTRIIGTVLTVTMLSAFFSGVGGVLRWVTR